MAEPSNVPYQAYRSKRHSRNFSNPRMVPNVSPPPSLSRPDSISSSPSPSPSPSPRKPDVEITEKEVSIAAVFQFPGGKVPQSPPVPVLVLEPPSVPIIEPVTPPDTNNDSDILEHVGISVPASPKPDGNDAVLPKLSNEGPPPSEASTSSFPVVNLPVRKISTFKPIPRKSRTPLPSSPLGPQHSRTSSLASMHTQQVQSMSQNHQDQPRIDTSTSLTVPSSPSHDKPPSPVSMPHVASRSHTEPTLQKDPSPPSRTSSFQPSPIPSPAPSPVPAPPPLLQPTHSSTPSSASSSHRNSRPIAPYRPGFQPRGVYRPLTGDFLALRRLARDGNTSQKRIERTKLERRLEKIINLHFPSPGAQKSSVGVGLRPQPRQRTSSLFDLKDFRRMSMADAGDLWRGVLSSTAPKDDIRATEQRITPWQEDSTVSTCPLCTTSFHPLTNRKHHCRLCGQIICALPVRHPQRPVSCSTLFVVDSKTRRIEEVEEGVDYGVRKRRPSSIGKAIVPEEDASEKFLKGVRICRDCRPVLLRQQYSQDVRVVPAFFKLYEAFIALEAEIEDALPQFQEMILGLSTDEQPTREATAARKRLLDVFAQYDAVAKRIRKLSCPPGGSQERIQIAVMTRATLFLQKNMFPLQSIPKRNSKDKKAETPKEDKVDNFVDPDSEVAQTLQPLLEQEALLETFVEEAKTRRKFEDMKTLKDSLVEIRAEIERVMVNADVGKGRRR